MNREQNLLYGVLAVQLRLLTPIQLARVAKQWVANPTRDLPERLIAAREFNGEDAAFIKEVMRLALRAHSNDPEQALNTFGGSTQINIAFGGAVQIADSDAATKLATGLDAESLSNPDAVPGVKEADGRYTRESEHARGGMGRIMLVHDEHLGRDIALKELLPDMPSDATTPAIGSGVSRTSIPLLARFLQEARITGKLEHPSIVPVYELGHRTDGRLYYTMKLVRGRSLAECISKAETLQERLQLLPHFVDMCQAMAYAHSKGVIHRDLKPDNVMVGEYGETVVIDWGLATTKGRRDFQITGMTRTMRKMSASDTVLDATKTAYGHALGTPAYMPPEQAKGQLDKIDERSDVYSLGAVLYELLTAKMPFEGSRSIEEILDKVISESPKAIRSIEPDAPAELAAICGRAMDKSPMVRYHSAKELAEDITRYQSGALVEVYEYKMSEVVRKFVRRHKPLVLTGAVGFATVIVLSLIYVLSILQANQNIRDSNDRLSKTNVRLDNSNEQLERARDVEKEQRLVMERQAYQSAILLAENHVESFRPSAARHVLMNAPESWRNWEWGFLFKRLDPSVRTFTSHLKAVTCAEFSPDGRRIVTASEDKTLIVWDLETGERVRTLTGHGQGVLSAAFSLDGRYVASASTDGDVRVWNATTGEALATLEGAGKPINRAVFSPDGKRVVTACEDGRAVAWNWHTAKEIFTLRGHEGSVRSVAFSPTGNRIVTASDDGTARVWDGSSGRLLFRLVGHTDAVLDAAFSPDGQKIVTGSRDTTAKIWNSRTGAEVLGLPGHRDAVSSVAFNKDGSRIVTGSSDRTCRIWESRSGKLVATLAGHNDGISTARFSLDGQFVLTASADRTIKKWLVKADADKQFLRGHEAAVFGGNFSPDGQKVVTASFDKTARVWDTDTLEVIFVLRGHQGRVYTASFSQDGTKIVTASEDKTAKLWDAATGAEILTITGHKRGIFYAAFNPDGKSIVTIPWEGSPRLWDGATGKLMHILKGHRGRIYSAQFSPDGTKLVTASDDNRARIWNANSGRELDTLTGHRAKVNYAEFDAAGKRILTASSDGTARTWDVGRGVELDRFEGHTDEVVKAHFSPDSNFVVTASADGTARVWTAATGRQLLVLVGHGGGVFDAEFSPDSQRILTASLDMTAKVWDRAVDEEPRTLSGHEKGLYGARFSPDGLRVMTLAGEGFAQIWEAVSWREEAWTDEARRGALIELARREPPKVEEYTFPIRRETILDRISGLLEALATVSTNGAESGHASEEHVYPILSKDGQGLLVAVAEEFESFQELGLVQNDLIVGINNMDTFSQEDAIRAIHLFLDDVDANPVLPHALQFEVYNYLQKRLVVLKFPGIITKRLVHLRDTVTGVLRVCLEESLPKSDEVFRQLLQRADLEPGDRIVELGALEIRDENTWIEALDAFYDALEQNEMTTMNILIARDRSDQYLQIELSIN